MYQSAMAYAASRIAAAATGLPVSIQRMEKFTQLPMADAWYRPRLGADSCLLWVRVGQAFFCLARWKAIRLRLHVASTAPTKECK